MVLAVFAVIVKLVVSVPSRDKVVPSIVISLLAPIVIAFVVPCVDPTPISN